VALKVRQGPGTGSGNAVVTQGRVVEILDLHTKSSAKPVKRRFVPGGCCGQHLRCCAGECTNEGDLGFAAKWDVEEQHGEADQAVPVGASAARSLRGEHQHVRPVGQTRFRQLSLVSADQRHEISCNAADSV
jgi:hypothetical protein